MDEIDGDAAMCIFSLSNVLNSVCNYLLPGQILLVITSIAFLSRLCITTRKT